MADKHSSEPIPEGWKFETKTKKDGSQVSVDVHSVSSRCVVPSASGGCSVSLVFETVGLSAAVQVSEPVVQYYLCHKTGQRFYTSGDMMRYVNYAKEAGLPVYLPNFDFRKKKKSGQSSESTPNQIEESLDSEKDTDNEKSLDSEKDNDSDTDKSMDSEKASNIKRSLDSEKDTGPRKSEFLKNDPIENISASLLDSLPSISEFMAYPEPMQISSEQAPVVEIPTFVPDTFPSDSGLNGGPEPMQTGSEQAPVVEIIPRHRRNIREMAMTPLSRIVRRRRRIIREQRIMREQAPVVQIPCPRIEVAVLPRNSRIMKRSHPRPNPHRGPR
ncbi:hypothetical protein Patl1_00387 [Pistacia atlantica]|uniref:Uncharacterized protein n=1 Tax=Pistacia atlantica TaxID=434234 RepID=A0ACC1C441_9ROSI|nr:hypothetical protein Patl1_00387 [Pistacia atlantica]